MFDNFLKIFYKKGLTNTGLCVIINTERERKKEVMNNDVGNKSKRNDRESDRERNRNKKR